MKVPRVFAAADIGSNTAHLLIAASNGQLVMRLDNYNEWIPLGEVVTRLGAIPKEVVVQLVAAVREFKRMANSNNAEQLYVFATEGMRMAANHSEVIQKIKADTGVQVEMISPKREAELSWAGIQLDTSHLPIGMMFEIGGGSAQIARIENGHIAESQSLPLGTGRVLAESGLGSPADSAAEQRAAHYIAAQLEELTIVSCGGLVASSGGVGRGLWRALHPDGEKLIHRNELDYLVWTASRLTVDRLVNRFNVKQKRAGTLLPGAMIYRAMLDHFGIEEFAVSEFGIREGAIIEISRGQK